MKRLVLSALLLMITALASPAMAASFDCAAAETPVEHAICDTPKLSLADDVLNKAFATAIGGLTEESANLMRADQRNWLGFAQAACAENAEALKRGTYDEDSASCMVNYFKDRVQVLENSRMISGHRFIISSHYNALPDPYAADDPNYDWKIATHQLVYPLLDSDDPIGPAFNAFIGPHIMDQAGLDTSSDGADIGLGDGSSDSNLKVVVSDVTDARITLESSMDWYGHGAAHGNSSLTYLHYLTAENRDLKAADVFDKEGWETKLAELAFAQLEADHAEGLDVSGPEGLAEMVVKPARWTFENTDGLTIQFQPYEVAAYAYGAPAILVKWDDLADFTSSKLSAIR